MKVWWENEDTGDAAHEPTSVPAIPREGDLVTFSDDEQRGRMWEVGPVRWDIGVGETETEVVIMVSDPDAEATALSEARATVHRIRIAPVDYQ